MPDNDLDADESRALGRLRTKKETINPALKEFIDRRKQMEVVELFGDMEPDTGYDYMKDRNR